MNHWNEVQEAIAHVQRHHAAKPKVGVVLGSGLGAFAQRLSATTVVPYAEIPHFPSSSVVGHAGELVLGEISGTPCVVMRGRVHYYEGHDIQRVTFPVRVLAGLGIQTLIVTNAAGGLNPSFSPGDLMVIADQLNLTGQSPLRGPNDERFGPRFPDMTEAYDQKARRVLHACARRHDATLREGVYAGLCGPSYETPAEIRMLQRLGADAVGMSTVAEVIAARHGRLRVAGLSVITNLAAGLSPAPLSHEEVTQTGERVKGLLCDILADAVVELAR